MAEALNGDQPRPESQCADAPTPGQSAPVCPMVPIEQHVDERGCLTTMQSGRDIPFEIKRVYTIFQVGGSQRRGCHAHRLERQLIVCMHGRCTIKISDGWQTETHVLDSPRLGLLIDKVIWREMYDFSPDCILMVLSDRAYDAQDYIREYADFLALVRPSGKAAEACPEFAGHVGNIGSGGKAGGVANAGSAVKGGPEK